MEKKAYIGWSNNDLVRKKSSSGGAFFTVAKYIIEQGGVVFGAAYDKNIRVKHIGISSMADLPKLQGSKYVQTELGNTFQLIESELIKGRLVLFTGTNCQCAGLKAYLGKEYKNLVAMDFICHGVPSQTIVDEYLKMLSEKYHSTPMSMSFRDKTNGWIKFGMRVTMQSGEEYKCVFGQDLFGKSFIANLFIRQCCYECRFKGYERSSDITVADMWGIEKFVPSHDDKGSSMVIVRGEKSEGFLKLLRNEMTLKGPFDFEKLVWNNQYAIKSVNKPAKRDLTFKSLYNNGFEKTVIRYTKISMIGRIKNKIKYLLKK